LIGGEQTTAGLGQNPSSTPDRIESVVTDTSSRLLTLLSLLQTRRDWPGRELADRLEVSGRTIRRDIERLRRLGYPVESVTGPAGGYRLRAGTAMPPLLLDDDEAIAIAVGLRTAARASVTGIEETSVRALVKLEQVLPAQLRRRVRALQSATLTLPAGGPTVEPQHLTIIAAACRDSERLRFAYRGRDGVRSRREVEPHSLVNLGRRWYLVAWDRDRRDWRTFRVDRLGGPASTGVRFAPRELPAKDGAAYVAQSLSAAPQRYQARVTLHAPAEAIRKQVPSYWGTIEPIDDRTCEYRTGDDDLGWLALRVAMLGVDFDVHEPAELGEHLLTLARRLQRAASTPRGAGRHAAARAT
jgi:predicted DNA-binding transcriptional regulator YafY